MLRRVARVLRWLSLLFGLLLLLSVPVSALRQVRVLAPWPRSFTRVHMNSGLLQVTASKGDVAAWNFLIAPAYDVAFINVLLPSFKFATFSRFEDTVVITIPIWLLAFLCLVWPVTSFFISRRHKRGFPIEPKDGGETVSTPVSPS